MTNQKNSDVSKHVGVFRMEAPPGFEPGVKDLQSHALPLGYGAVVGRRSLHFSFRRRAKPIGEKFRIRSRLPPLKSKTMFCICFRVRYVSLYESVPCGTEKWSGRRGSNSLPPPWQGGALPDELRPHDGASGRNRTNDTRIFSPLLYHLSYRGIYTWWEQLDSNQ